MLRYLGGGRTIQNDTKKRMEFLPSVDLNCQMVLLTRQNNTTDLQSLLYYHTQQTPL